MSSRSQPTQAAAGAPLSLPDVEQLFLGWYVVRAGTDDALQNELLTVDDDLILHSFNRSLLKAMRMIVAAGEPIEKSTVRSAVQRLDPTASMADFYAIVDAGEQAISPVVYLRQLREVAARRRLDAHARFWLDQATDPAVDPQDVLADVRSFCEQAPAPATRFKLLDRAAIQALPDPDFLVEEIIVRDTLASLYGPSETAKTFLALALSLSVTTGKPWLGHAVKQVGHAVYIAAEGAAGIKRRLLAWEAHHGIVIPPRFRLITETPNVLATGDVDTLVAALRTLPGPPLLVVLDTLNRCMPGGNENAPEDMGKIIAAGDRIRRTFAECTVLILHHPNAEGTRERGHTSFRNALDTMLVAACAGTPGTDPVRKRVFLEESPHRTRYLADDEQERLQAALPPDEWPKVLLALCTGLDRSPQFTLRWDQVCLDARTILTGRYKGGHRGGKGAILVTSPINDELLAVLRTLPSRLKSEWVFPNDAGTGPLAADSWVRHVFRPALRAARIRGFRWKDLRHTYATRLNARNGVGMKTIATLLGHTTTRMTERYTHATRAARCRSGRRLRTKCRSRGPRIGP